MSRKESKPRYKHTCEYCHDEYVGWNKAQRFCSKQCQGLGFRGPNNPHFKGGHVLKQSGYRIIYRDGKRGFEHRFIMEEAIGRELMNGEVIHHRDGNKLNNVLSNLELHNCNAVHMGRHSKWYRDTHQKQCRICHKIKPRSDFYKQSPGKLTGHNDPHRTECKTCYQEDHRQRMRRR